MSADIEKRLNKLTEKVIKLDERVNDHSKLLEKQAEKNEMQIEMNTLLKLQIEANKEQNKQLEKFANTLKQIDKNLSKLNANQEQITINQEKLGERVSKIEDVLEERKIDLASFSKKILTYITTTIIGIIISYYALKFGLKK